MKTAAVGAADPGWWGAGRNPRPAAIGRAATWPAGARSAFAFETMAPDGIEAPADLPGSRRQLREALAIAERRPPASGGRPRWKRSCANSRRRWLPHRRWVGPGRSTRRTTRCGSGGWRCGEPRLPEIAPPVEGRILRLPSSARSRRCRSGSMLLPPARSSAGSPLRSSGGPASPKTSTCWKRRPWLARRWRRRIPWRATSRRCVGRAIPPPGYRGQRRLAGEE